MRILFVVCLSIFFANVACAQANPNQYSNFKKMLNEDGWTIGFENKLYLKQGESDEAVYELQANRQYKIFLMSDDPEVDDADMWVYDASSNTLLDKDVESTRMAIADVTGAANKKVKVVGKNMKSTTPDTRSKIYIVVAYKQLAAPTPSQYDFSTLQKVSDFLNENMLGASINFSDPKYPFNVLGKTDFDRRSVEFVTKNSKIFIKLHMPRNGNCEYGLKEIAAELNGQSGTVSYSNGTRGYYYAFKFSYNCDGKVYKDIYITIKDIPEADRETLKLKLRQ